MRGAAAFLLVVLLVVACGDESDTLSSDACAHVVDAEIERAGDGTYIVSATVSSGDTGWDKYADAWEVRDEDGAVLGVRELLHPHVDEQPFTRSLSGVEIPDGVARVILAARDSVEGFCGDEFGVAIP